MITPTRLQSFIPFEELSLNALEELVPHFQTLQLKPKSVLFKRGQCDEYCHYLLSGDMDLINERFEVSRFNGEDEANILALDATHPIHKSSAVAINQCEVARIPRRYIELVSTWIELALSNTQGDADGHDWLETLLTSELFNRVPPGNIQQLLSRFEEREVSLGDVLIREGDEAKECYVIKHGKALVTRKDGRNDVTLAGLTNGALFGEDSLISAMPRSATVTMSSDGVVMVLSKEDFDTLLKTPVLEYVDEDAVPEMIENSDVGIVILDVRTQQEAGQSSLARSRNIPLAQLRSRLSELSKDFIYIIQGGGRAEAAAYILSEAGFSVKVAKH